MSLQAAIQRRQGFTFLPIVYRLAARLEQIPWEELAEDTSSAAYALRAAQGLFHLPALVSHFRVGVEAEACGAELARDENGAWREPVTLADPKELGPGALERPPLRLALELTARLSEELRGTAEVVAVLSGPRTLSALFAQAPSSLSQFYPALARAYAERGVQALLVVESAGNASQPLPAGFSFAPLLNVARYFRLGSVLMDSSASPPTPGAEFNLVVGGSGAKPLPLTTLSEPPSGVETWRREGGPLLLTEWEVPPDLPAERLAAWIEALSAAAPAEKAG